MTSNVDSYSSSSDEQPLYKLATGGTDNSDMDLESDEDYAFDKDSEDSSDCLSDQFGEVQIQDNMDMDVEVNDENDENFVVDQSTDEDINSLDNNKWVKGDLATHFPEFQGEFGLSENIHLPPSPSPVDILLLFLSPNIIEYIIHQSNLYATQRGLKQKPMDVLDFYKLIGFLFYSSLVKLPSKSDYWSELSKQDIVRDSISRNRVDELLRIIHFSDNILNKQKYDKIQPLIDLFNGRCQDVVKQEKNIVIDEQMVGYKGKTAPSALKQFLPQKPTKHGFKLWCKSSVSGFVYKINLYHGSDKASPKPILTSDKQSIRVTRLRNTTTENIQEQTDAANKKDSHSNTKDLGVAGMVVIDLIKNVSEGTNVFVNNYFGSISLIKRMTELGLGITCTLKGNRIGDCPLPSEKVMAAKPRGYYDYRITNDKKCALVAWKDSKRVILGSNYVAVHPVVSFIRYDKKSKQKVIVQASQIVKEYNLMRGGVDTTNMMCSLHPIPFRSKKWYMRLAWRIFDLMVLNSWLLSKHLFGRDGNWRIERLFHFKLCIAQALLQYAAGFSKVSLTSLATISSSDQSENDDADDKPLVKNKLIKRESRLSVSNSLRHDHLDHWPLFKQRKYSTRCKNEGCNKRTKWTCSKCQIHLCVHSDHNCFTSYHNQS